MVEQKDYPDWTDMVQLIGTDIMLAIDIQGAYIMMPVDIQGQIGELNINITASEVTMDIDIEAQSVGVYLKADWEVLQEHDKRFLLTGTIDDFNGLEAITYEIPERTKLYIVACSFAIRSENAADYDHHIRGRLEVNEQVSGLTKIYLGGEGGASLSLPTPIVFEHGETLGMAVWNYSNVSVYVSATLLGFELST